MGASGWQYIVPFQPDFQRALDELRAAVYARGEYHHVQGPFYDLDPNLDPDDPNNGLREVHREPPTTLEELISYNADEGTHSILDVDLVSSDTGMDCLVILTDAELEQLLGSTRPTREQALAQVDALAAKFGGWSGSCVVLYEAGEPREILFAGMSGD